MKKQPVEVTPRKSDRARTVYPRSRRDVAALVGCRRTTARVPVTVGGPTHYAQRHAQRETGSAYIFFFIITIIYLFIKFIRARVYIYIYILYVSRVFQIFFFSLGPQTGFYVNLYCVSRQKLEVLYNRIKKIIIKKKTRFVNILFIRIITRAKQVYREFYRVQRNLFCKRYTGYDFNKSCRTIILYILRIE